MSLIAYYESNKKIKDHRYYIEIVDNSKCSSIKFDLVTKKFILFEKRRLKKRIQMELKKSKLLLESMDFNLENDEKLQFLVLKTL